MSSFIPNNEHYLKRARNIRNELLNKTDRYMLEDYPNLTPEETDRIRQALVDEIEQEIEGIRVGIYERYESHRIDTLSDDDWFDEVLNSL